MRGREMENERETDRFDEQEANTMSNRFWCFKIRACSSGGSTAQKSVRCLQFSLYKLKVSVPLYFVPVSHYYGTVVSSGTISLVPSISSPLDQGGQTVPKNANHYKTYTHKMNNIYSEEI
jgi:hypothetical protein